MKHLLAGCCVAALLTGAASAADIGGSLKDGPVSFSDGKAISWTGIYVGGQIGYGNSNHNLNATETRSRTIIDTPASPEGCSGNFTLVNGKCYAPDQFDFSAPKAGATDTPSAHYEGCGDGSIPTSDHRCGSASSYEKCDGGFKLKDHKCYAKDQFDLIVDPTANDDAHIAAVKEVSHEVIDTANMFIDGLNSSGIFGGGTVGADLQRGRLVFGVFGDYNISDAKMTAGADFNGTDVFSASIEDGNSWIVAGRLGYLVTDRALLYALGGYGQQDVTYKFGTDSLDKTFSGWVVGGGGEYALSQNIFLALEYQHFFGGKETLVDKDGLLVTDELDTDKVMAKVKIKFGN